MRAKGGAFPLHFKLLGVFSSILGAACLAVFLVTLRSAGLYQTERQQRDSKVIARGIAERVRPASGPALRLEVLEDVFADVRLLSPDLELYLLDRGGRVLAHDPLRGTLASERVALAPVRALLTEPGRLVLGEDPRQSRRLLPFTAHPIVSDGQERGFVYVVLAAGRDRSPLELFGASTVLQNAAWLALAALFVASLAGAAASEYLTRPLRRLRDAMSRFREERLPPQVHVHGGDEIAVLAGTYNRMARRIGEQVKTLERTDRQRRDLVASISHDLRTPLASVQGHLELLRDRSAALAANGAAPAPELARYVEIALRNARQLAALVDQLFELARFDAGEVVPELEEFSIAELVSDVLQGLALRARQRGIRLRWTIPAEPPQVLGDIGLIERAITNLLGNALKFTPRGGTIAVRLRASGEGVEVSVSDTGCGIPEEDLPHVFERFYRVDRSRQGRAGGAGLGLAITKRILELHDGHIEVQSRVGAGTVFRMVLPRPPWAEPGLVQASGRGRRG